MRSFLFMFVLFRFKRSVPGEGVATDSRIFFHFGKKKARRRYARFEWQIAFNDRSRGPQVFCVRISFSGRLIVVISQEAQIFERAPPVIAHTPPEKKSMHCGAEITVLISFSTSKPDCHY